MSVMRLFGINFFGNMIPFYILMSNILLSYCKFSLETTLFILTIHHFTKGILYIPTGILFDSIQKKYIFHAYTLLKIIGMFIFLIDQSNMYLIILAVMLFAISEASFYGKIEGYIYAELDKEGKIDQFSKYASYLYLGGHLGMTLSSFLGNFIYKYYSYDGLVYLGIISLLISFYISIPLPSSQNIRRKSHKWHNAITDSISLLKKNSILLTSVVAGGIISSCYFSFQEVSKIFITNKGVSTDQISLIFGYLFACKTIATYICTLKCVKSNTFTSLTLVIIVFIISIISLFISDYLSIISLFLYVIFFIYINVSLKTIMHQNLDDDVRLTISSVTNALKSISDITILAIFGYFYNILSFSIIASMLIFIFALLPVFILYTLHQKRLIKIIN
jgi:predicted MFS family arabinose efflux permease